MGTNDESRVIKAIDALEREEIGGFANLGQLIDWQMTKSPAALTQHERSGWQRVAEPLAQRYFGELPEPWTSVDGGPAYPPTPVQACPACRHAEYMHIPTAGHATPCLAQWNHRCECQGPETVWAIHRALDWLRSGRSRDQVVEQLGLGAYERQLLHRYGPRGEEPSADLCADCWHGPDFHFRGGCRCVSLPPPAWDRSGDAGLPFRYCDCRQFWPGVWAVEATRLQRRDEPDFERIVFRLQVKFVNAPMLYNTHIVANHELLRAVPAGVRFSSLPVQAGDRRTGWYTWFEKTQTGFSAVVAHEDNNRGRVVATCP